MWSVRAARPRVASTSRLSADLIDPGRVNILERWESAAAVEAFRGSGVDDEQGAAIVSASVAEYEVGATRSLS